MRTNVAIAIRALRRMRRWRQQDLGERARLSRDTVSRAEQDELDGLTIGSLARLADALGATLIVELRWRGAELDRLVDRQHAHLQDAAARRVASRGWTVRAEVSFNHYGDRGSCDLVAWHPKTATLLVIEVKSQLGNLQDLLYRLDVKARLGGLLAEELGWLQPRVVVRALVLPEDRTARRILAQHEALFGRFDLRGRAAAAWLRSPSESARGLIWFEEPANSGDSRTSKARSATRQRSAGKKPAVDGPDCPKDR